VSIAEEFTVGRFIDATEPAVPAVPTFVPKLWENEVANASSTWNRRVASWRRIHELNLKAFPFWSEFDGFICARNTIAHGLGRLTPRQLRNEETMKRLRAADIAVHARRIALGTTDIEKCAWIATSYIDWLDISAPVVAAA
jgi:hypothetical protein